MQAFYSLLPAPRSHHAALAVDAIRLGSGDTYLEASRRRCRAVCCSIGRTASARGRPLRWSFTVLRMKPVVSGDMVRIAAPANGMLHMVRKSALKAMACTCKAFQSFFPWRFARQDIPAQGPLLCGSCVNDHRPAVTARLRVSDEDR